VKEPRAKPVRFTQTAADHVLIYTPLKVLITGPSPSSIGAPTAYALAAANAATLLLLGRSADKLKPVVERIRDINASTQVIVVEVDLSSLGSVSAAAHQILKNPLVSAIDVVINNAGIMAGPYRKSIDGIELQFATCHVRIQRRMTILA
jgi:NADP-dependent 3-hydroxy acid dehydrogenase YdfG